MKIKHIEGLISAPFTPMKEDGSLNLEVIPGYYEMLVANKVTGAFICGSTGEGVSLTLEEKKEVAEAWASAAKGNADFKIITLVGGTCIKDAIELAKHAEKTGLHAIAFTAPFYFKPAGVKQLAECCKTIADEVPEMPFYYYHIPVLNGVNFPMIELLQHASNAIPNFAGIKYTHEDFMDFLSCLRFENGKYNMLWGRDENMLASLVLGSRGAVGSTYNYAAPLYNAMIEAYNKGAIEEARQLQQQSIDMISLLGKYGGIATGKAYMKLVHVDCGKFRLPVKNMNDSDFELFRKDTEKINFKSFCSTSPSIVNH